MSDRAEKPVDDPRVYLAAERTLLAWVRTGLSLMGFGFVVARFGLFMREIAFARAGDGAGTGGAGAVVTPAASAGVPAPGSGGASLWFGVALVVAGVLVTALAAADHGRVVRSLRHGDTTPATKSAMGVVLALLLAVLGAAMAVYLVAAAR